MKRSLLLLLVLLSSHANAADLKVSSLDYVAGGNMSAQNVLQGFGCSGANLSPDVAWSGAPADTKSFAVTIYDPDAPTGSGWWHWTVFNIPAAITQLPEGASLNPARLPQGAVEGVTDFGKPGYGGACPPQGDKPHRYILTVYALKVPHLDVPATASGAMVGFFLHQNALAHGSITATYAR